MPVAKEIDRRLKVGLGEKDAFSKPGTRSRQRDNAGDFGWRNTEKTLWVGGKVFRLREGKMGPSVRRNVAPDKGVL
jgi:hypothetical protein